MRENVFFSVFSIPFSPCAFSYKRALLYGSYFCKNVGGFPNFNRSYYSAIFYRAPVFVVMHIISSHLTLVLCSNAKFGFFFTFMRTLPLRLSNSKRCIVILLKSGKNDKRRPADRAAAQIVAKTSCKRVFQNTNCTSSMYATVPPAIDSSIWRFQACSPTTTATAISSGRPWLPAIMFTPLKQ